MKKIEAGRTLLETLAVLMVMAILLIASLVGYNVLIHQWRKHQTVKAVSELAVRYKMRPVAQEGPVTIKSIYPEAERASSVEMKTADTEAGRVKLEVFSEPTSFAVVVQHILDDSCESILENGDYDAVVEGKEINATSATEENAFSKKYLQSLSKEDREALIEKICRGEMDTMGLVYGDHCPRMGASYWYRGRCWNCASNRDQDNYGNCCAKGTVDVCGFCPGKCPNGGVCNTKTKLCVECTENDKGENVGSTTCQKLYETRPFCDTSANKCVECLNPGERCSGETEKYCMRNHTCQECDTTKHLFWNKELDICECASPLIVVGEACFDGCCVDGAFCHEGVCAACWLDYDPLNPGAEGMCPSERPLCQSGTCQGCPAKPTTAGAACYTLCGCDETKGLACDASGTCQCQEGSTWDPITKQCVICIKGCDGVCGSGKVNDCLGVCGGTATLGCDGVCNSGKVNDCLGVCGGTATLGCDGICNSGKVNDCLGVCGGTATLGCDGVCNSGKVDTGCGCGIDCPQEEIQECCFETTHECQSLFGLTEVMDDVDETGFIFCKNTDGSRPKDGCCGIRLINRTNTDKDKVSYRARYEIIENKNNVTINKYCVGNAQTDLNKHMIEAKKGSSWGQWITKSLYKSGPCTPFGTFSNNVKQEACSLFGKDCSGKGRVKVRTCVQFKLGE